MLTPPSPGLEPEPDPSRWELLRDVSVFQVKLALDAIRDVVLSPVSLIAALSGLLFRPDRPGHFFYRLLREGRRSDKFIDLFGASGPSRPEPSPDDPSLDAIVERLQGTLVDQYRKGGVTATAKHQIDRVLDVVERKPKPREPEPSVSRREDG